MTAYTIEGLQWHYQIVVWTRNVALLQSSADSDHYWWLDEIRVFKQLLRTSTLQSTYKAMCINCAVVVNGFHCLIKSICNAYAATKAILFVYYLQ